MCRGYTVELDELYCFAKGFVKALFYVFLRGIILGCFRKVLNSKLTIERMWMFFRGFFYIQFANGKGFVAENHIETYVDTASKCIASIMLEANFIQRVIIIKLLF